MRYATRDDYRAALREHRSWPATAAMFFCGLLASAAVIAVGALALMIAGHPVSAAWMPIALVGGLGLTWMDAAHRLAGERANNRR